MSQPLRAVRLTAEDYRSEVVVIEFLPFEHGPTAEMARCAIGHSGQCLSFCPCMWPTVRFHDHLRKLGSLENGPERAAVFTCDVKKSIGLVDYS